MKVSYWLLCSINLVTVFLVQGMLKLSFVFESVFSCPFSPLYPLLSLLDAKRIECATGSKRLFYVHIGKFVFLLKLVVIGCNT